MTEDRYGLCVKYERIAYVLYFTALGVCIIVCYGLFLFAERSG